MITLLFILFFQLREVSIWLRPQLRDYKVFVDGIEQVPLHTSTPSNFRFETTKKEIEIMLASPDDTVRRKVRLKDGRTVIAF